LQSSSGSRRRTILNMARVARSAKSQPPAYSIIDFGAFEIAAAAGDMLDFDEFLELTKAPRGRPGSARARSARIATAAEGVDLAEADLDTAMHDTLLARRLTCFSGLAVRRCFPCDTRAKARGVCAEPPGPLAANRHRRSQCQSAGQRRCSFRSSWLASFPNCSRSH
jgi:hypothetical protein